MFDDIKLMDYRPMYGISEAGDSITLKLHGLEDEPLVRISYKKRTPGRVQLRFEIPKPLLFVNSLYGYHWGCTICHYVIGQNTEEAQQKAVQWAKQVVEMSYFQSTEVSGPVINI